MKVDELIRMGEMSTIVLSGDQDDLYEQTKSWIMPKAYIVPVDADLEIFPGEGTPA